jgi:hypothetical protein
MLPISVLLGVLDNHLPLPLIEFILQVRQEQKNAIIKMIKFILQIQVQAMNYIRLYYDQDSHKLYQSHADYPELEKSR